MPSTLASQKIGSKQKLVAEKITGGTTVVSAYTDMRDFIYFGGLVAVSALTGSGVTKVEIVAADDDSGTNLTVIKDSGTVAADAVDDQVFVECIESEISALSDAAGYDLRYAAVRVTLDNAADVAALTTVAVPGRAFSGLTPATTIA